MSVKSESNKGTSEVNITIKFIDALEDFNAIIHSLGKFVDMLEIMEPDALMSLSSTFATNEKFLKENAERLVKAIAREGKAQVNYEAFELIKSTLDSIPSTESHEDTLTKPAFFSLFTKVQANVKELPTFEKKVNKISHKYKSAVPGTPLNANYKKINDAIDSFYKTYNKCWDIASDINDIIELYPVDRESDFIQNPEDPNKQITNPFRRFQLRVKSVSSLWDTALDEAFSAEQIK